MFKDKKFLVTGGTGSIGSEIVRQLLKYEPKQIRILSRDEYKQFIFQQEFEKLPPGKVSFLLGDIRDKERIMLAMEGIDIVFHTAALKHVPHCEYNPFEAVKTNVLGTQNVVDAARYFNIEKLIGISTDKAASPISTMGATKLLAEKIIISAEEYKGSKRTCFSVVRFGNVIGSRGSVIPLLIKQVLSNEEVTLTDPQMTRFIMSIPDAINLVFKAAINAKGGELFILKMPVLRLIDLVDCLIEVLSEKFDFDKSHVNIKTIGKRRGEKSYETLISEEESEYVFENDEMFYLMNPDNHNLIVSYKKAVIKSYRSDEYELMSKESIRKEIELYLLNNNIEVNLNK
jgi:FlaA1/EpsC-like NDP-sugar epimerase